MRRFSWIYDRNTASDNPFDLDLSPTGAFATIPTLGSIVPNWVLFIPRVRAQNIAALGPQVRKQLLSFARNTMSQLHTDGQLFFFEHGSQYKGSPVGCGVDQAHLHAVILPFSLLDAFRRDRSKCLPSGSADPWVALNPAEYLLCGDRSEFYFSPMDIPESQYFRKLIAKNLGVAELWDYRQHPFVDNIVQTVSALNGSAAA